MNMYDSLVPSGYQGLLTQYYDNTGRVQDNVSISGSWVDTSVPAPTGVKNYVVSEEAAHAAAVNGWPSDINTQIVVLSAPGSTYNFTKEEEGFCAWHSWSGAGNESTHTFLPFPGDPPFNSGCDPSGYSTYASHEFAETVTDPRGSGWITSRSWEIGDICAAGSGTTGGITFAGLWSYDLGGCATTSDPAAPEAPRPSLTQTTRPSATTGAAQPRAREAYLYSTGIPNGMDTIVYFQYGPSESYGSSSASQEIGWGEGQNHTYGNSPVAADMWAKGLSPATTYHYRAVATNWWGTTYGADGTFTTLTLPYVETSTAVAHVGQATLRGVVNPRGSVTTYQFEYGPTTSYGSKAPASPASAGSGQANVNESASAMGLKPCSTYHYRIEASNENGTEYGSDVEFHTLCEPSDVNGDGHADLVSLSPGREARVFPGQSSGEFGSSIYSLSGLDPAQYDGEGSYPVDVADVNGDSRGDLVGWNSSGGVTVYPGNANQTFGAGVNSLSGLMPGVLQPNGYEPIGVADVNGDGRGDLVAYAPGAEKVYVWPGQASYTFGGPLASLSGMNSATFDGSGEYFVGVGDVNGDGYADLVTQTSAGTLKVYPGQAGLSFGAAVESHKNELVPAMNRSSGWEPVGLGDVNGDGRADFVAISGGVAYVSLGTESGSFGSLTNAAVTGSSSLYENTGFQALGVIDINGDGRADLFGINNSTTQLEVFEGKVGGGLEAPINSVTAGYRTTQHERNLNANGDEIATEKPMLRRSGCDAAYCSGGWSSSPLPSGSNEVEEISCASSSWCVGVGTYTDESGHHSVQASKWNGSSWSPLTVPEPSGAFTSKLNGVSCASASFCMAVGSYVPSSGPLTGLVETWNGSAWTISATPSPVSGSPTELKAIACTSTTLCEVAGRYLTSGSGWRPLVYHWTGGAWTSWTSILPSGAEWGELYDVSCRSGSVCVSVGRYGATSQPVQALGIAWNGSSYSLSLPGTTGELTDVSCSAAEGCVAVGVVGSSPRIVRQKSAGGSWSTISAPTAPAGALNTRLGAVSCPTLTCYAVGSYDTATGTAPYALSIGEASASSEAISAPANALKTYLNGISCTSASECRAAGAFSSRYLGLTDVSYARTGGAWARTTSDTTPIAGGLRRDSCLLHFCMAVGSSRTPSGTAPVARTLQNGSEWSTLSTPQLSPVGTLGSVSCLSSTWCEALGGQAGHPLAEQWNGSSWSTQTTPSLLGVSPYGGISCTSTSHCMAATNRSLEEHPVALWWDGSSWTETSPQSIGEETGFKDASCAGAEATVCFAAGFDTLSFLRNPLVEKYSEGTWSVLPSPPMGSGERGQLNGISCTSASACVAVGSFQSGSNPAVGLIDRWSGGVWERQELGLGESQRMILNDVSCYQATRCVAVGRSTIESSSSFYAVVLRWNGGANWTISYLPEPRGASRSSLEGISCDAEGHCLATGWTEVAGIEEPLAIKSGPWS